MSMSMPSAAPSPRFIPATPRARLLTLARGALSGPSGRLHRALRRLARQGISLGAGLAVGAAIALATAGSLLPSPAQAQVPAPEIAARAWLLVDVSTRTVLYGRASDERFEPASLTKLMTAYLVFNALKEKRLAMDHRPPVSPQAHKAIGSRMFIEPRSPATIDELLHGLIIQSGNDAAIALAEAIAGSETQFSEMMNAEARRIGMVNTNFTNASGLPGPNHYSTARDLATLTIRLIEDHPEYYRMYSEKEYTYNKIRQPNRNRLLFTDPSVDGVKTGHTDAAGYCLISSAMRQQPGSGASRRMLSVLLGASSESTRAIESQKLLNFGFQNFDIVSLYKQNDPIGNYQVWKGAAADVKVGFTEEVRVTVPKAQADTVKAEIERVEPLVAPIAAGQRIGTLRVKLGDRVLSERPVVALEDVPLAGWFGRTWDTIRLWIK